MTWTVVASNALWLLGLMTALWLLSVWKRDASVVDPWWSMAFLLVTARTALSSGWTTGKVALLTVVAIWALRLWLHLLNRSRGKPEDPRYAEFRQRYGAERYWWVSYFQVFLLQGCLVLMISAPLQISASTAQGLSVFDVVGGAVALGGTLFEAVADAQLHAFRQDPTRRGQVLDTGLWRYSRHPNYFGEAVLWWGFWLMTCDEPGSWATWMAPLLMTVLLLRVSGVTLLDQHLARTKAGFADYQRSTSAFVPRRPRP